MRVKEIDIAKKKFKDTFFLENIIFPFLRIFVRIKKKFFKERGVLRHRWGTLNSTFCSKSALSYILIIQKCLIV